MLAPVLARLDAIPGVIAARADASGRFFWIALDLATDAPRVTAQARGVLGEDAGPLRPAQAEAQLASHHRGDPWWSAAEVMTLSYVESRILSVRLASAAEHQAGLVPEQREVVADAIRLELFAAMERVHAEGGRRGGGWILAEWPGIAIAAVERCTRSLPARTRAALLELLPTLLAP